MKSDVVFDSSGSVWCWKGLHASIFWDYYSLSLEIHEMDPARQEVAHFHNVTWQLLVELCPSMTCRLAVSQFLAGWKLQLRSWVRWAWNVHQQRQRPLDPAEAYLLAAITYAANLPFVSFCSWLEHLSVQIPTSMLRWHSALLWSGCQSWFNRKFNISNLVPLQHPFRVQALHWRWHRLRQRSNQSESVLDCWMAGEDCPEWVHLLYSYEDIRGTY